MRILSARLDDLDRGPCGPEIRAGIELLMDTGRRPSEIAGLPLDCLARDADGSPMLLYDNRKGARHGRRLPVTQATAEVITRQQQRVRERFPAAPLARLALPPTVMGNPEGTRPVSVTSLIQRHRDWVSQQPASTHWPTSPRTPHARASCPGRNRNQRVNHLRALTATGTATPSVTPTPGSPRTSCVT